jgi:sugar O-acyltransferase (sialic acid O-acetyltransferase NeuD family)
MKKYIIFGHSAFLSDIFDLIHANHGMVYKIYQNMPEVGKARVIGLKERIALLGYDVQVYGSLDAFSPEEGCSYALGTPSPQKYKLVEMLKEKYSLRFSSLIHPSVILGSHIHIGEGVTINVQTVIAANAFLGDFCSINRCSSVGHDTRVGKYSLINPGVTIAGAIQIGEKCTIGMKAAILDGLCVGDWAVIGAGSLVTKDVPSRVVAYGVPAKGIRENDEVDYDQYKAKRSIS